MRHFLELYSKEAKREGMEISSEAQSILENHAWPGNGRKLQNTIRYVVAMSPNTCIRPQDLPELNQLEPGMRESAAFRKVLYETKRELLKDAVLKTPNRTQAAPRFAHQEHVPLSEKLRPDGSAMTHSFAARLSIAIGLMIAYYALALAFAGVLIYFYFVHFKNRDLWSFVSYLGLIPACHILVSLVPNRARCWRPRSGAR
jgi:hypothetical protein